MMTPTSRPIPTPALPVEAPMPPPGGAPPPPQRAGLVAGRGGGPLVVWGREGGPGGAAAGPAGGRGGVVPAAGLVPQPVAIFPRHGEAAPIPAALGAYGGTAGDVLY